MQLDCFSGNSPIFKAAWPHCHTDRTVEDIKLILAVSSHFYLHFLSPTAGHYKEIMYFTTDFYSVYDDEWVS